jgi:hypothetical protein
MGCSSNLSLITTPIKTFKSQLISTITNNKQDQKQEEENQLCVFFSPVNTDQPKVANFVSSLSWKKKFMKT